MSLKERVLKRFSGEEVIPDEGLIDELITTITDRVNLRAGTEILPDVLGSIVVDATIKMCRKQYYEGVSSEGAESMSTSFIDDVLAEYAQEIAMYQENVSRKKVVRLI